MLLRHDDPLNASWYPRTAESDVPLAAILARKGVRFCPNMKDWKSGDVVLCLKHSSLHFNRSAIAVYQRYRGASHEDSLFYHAAIYYRDGLVADLTPFRGVSLTPVRQLAAQCTIRRRRLRDDLPISLDQFEYGFKQLASKPYKLHVVASQANVCSSFVRTMLWFSTGFNLFGAKPFVTPSDFSASDQLVDMPTYWCKITR